MGLSMFLLWALSCNLNKEIFTKSMEKSQHNIVTTPFLFWCLKTLFIPLSIFLLVDGTIIMVFIQFLLIELVTRCVISTSFFGVSISDNLTNCILFHTILCHKKLLKQGCDKGFEGRRKVYYNMKRYFSFSFHGNVFSSKKFICVYNKSYITIMN